MRDPAARESRIRQLILEAPARARNWIERRRAGEQVPDEKLLNPIIQDAVRTYRAMFEHKPAPRFSGEPQLTWEAWCARDGRLWNGTQSIPFDQPLDAVHGEDDPYPTLVARPHTRSGGIQRIPSSAGE